MGASQIVGARALLLALGVMVVAVATASGQQVGVPAFLLGDFVDDYGTVYSVSEGRWQHGTASRYDIVAWNVDELYFVARNHEKYPGEAGLWTRVDWVKLDDPSPFAWAYCYAIYDAATRADAVVAPSSERMTPRTGCNGFPFSRMQRSDGVVPRR